MGRKVQPAERALSPQAEERRHRCHTDSGSIIAHIPWRVKGEFRFGSGHKARLKEINKSKEDFPFGMVKAIVVFGNTKTIISGYKDFYYRIKSFQLSRETPASSGKNRDIMAQISVDTLNSESVLFVVNIVNMPSRIYHIQISNISVCVISTGFWRGVYDSLYPLRCFVLCHIKARYHAWISAYRGHHIHIFAGFGIWLFTNKPV